MLGANTQKQRKSDFYGKDEGSVKKQKKINPLPSWLDQ